MHVEVRTKTNGTLIGWLDADPGLMSQLTVLRNKMMPTVQVSILSDYTSSPVAASWREIQPIPKLQSWTIQLGVVPFEWTNLETRQTTIIWMLVVDDLTEPILRGSPKFQELAK